MEKKKPYEVIRINQNTWMIQEETVRFFLLAGTERSLLIDSGCAVHNAKEIAQKLTSLPCVLANTHTDGDHTGSNEEFPFVYMNPSEYMFYRKTQKHTNIEVRPLWDGQIIDLGKRPVRVVSIPGHTPGSLAFLDIKNKFLFSGDPFQDGTIYMFGEQRDIAAYEASLRKLLEMDGQFEWLFPCHGSGRVSKEILPKLLEGVETMRKGKIAPVKAVYLDTEVHEYHIGPAVILYDADAVFPER